MKSLNTTLSIITSGAVPYRNTNHTSGRLNSIITKKSIITGRLTARMISILAVVLLSTPLYAAVNVLHAWHLDEAAGATSFADDGSGVTIPLSVVGSPVSGVGSVSGFGTAVELSNETDGLSGGEEVQTTDVLGINHMTVGFTIEALVRFNAISGDPREILSMDNDGNATTRPFQFVLSDNGTILRFQGIASGGQHNISLPAAGDPNEFIANEWYHVAVTYNGAQDTSENLKFYWTRVGASVAEASLLGTSMMTGDVGSSSGDLAIGNELRADPGEGLIGRIDEVIISEGVKTAAEFAVASAPDGDEDGLSDTWEQQIIDADSTDAITQITDVLPSDNFDGDAYTNLQEYENGTDPTQYTDPEDWDGDGLPDAWETTYFLSIEWYDGTGNPDGDIYDNATEYANGTDPSVFTDPNDTDADGLPDTWEQQIIDADINDTMTAVEDVLPNGDFDQDGFSNAEEYENDTDPTDAQSVPGDSDVDGLSDSWEQTYFGSLEYDATDNPDGDSADNGAEQAAGTDPNDLWDYPGAPFDPGKPTGLMVDLLAHPDRTTIPDTEPEFSWIFHERHRGEYQSAYELIVASTHALAGVGTGDIWSSGKIASDESVDVDCGVPLTRGETYVWRVRTWGTDQTPSVWSAVQSFTIESSIPLSGARSISKSSSNEFSGRYEPAFDTVVSPVRFVDKGDGNYFIDFGRDGFGYVTIRLDGSFAGQSMTVHLGEDASDDSVNDRPPRKVRYASETVELSNGTVTYEVRIASHESFSEVMPFRYVELVDCPDTLTADNILQYVLSIPFDESAASFTSANDTLNQVYDLCKYSMKATSFCGVYIDGDRERLPYEADAYINQLGHYSSDREFTMARYSYEYLLDNSTWPTEWKMLFPLMAWADYMHTGNQEALASNYLQIVSYIDQYEELMRSDGILVNSYHNIVDWPTTERDDYAIDGNNENTVVNAYLYKSWRILAEIATVLNNETDAATFTAHADLMQDSFTNVFWNGSLYQDGESFTHVSAHANFFPMAFGLVPPDRVESVMTFLKGKRMPCSVYGAQYLLEALFAGNEEDFAIGLMSDNDPTYNRNWYNMIREGSTISMEAWGNEYKGNQDWNHAWGAAPANIIPRYVLGIKPLTAGFALTEIKPQLGTGDGTNGLQYASGTVPSLRGPFTIAVSNAPSSFSLQVEIPGNVTATVLIPSKGLADPTVLFDGIIVQAPVVNGRLVIENVPGGKHSFQLSPTTTPDDETLKSNWKYAMFGTDLSEAGDPLDPDNDGWTTEEEFYANTDPLDALDAWASQMQLMDHQFGPFNSTFEGRSGRQYSLERSPSLLPPSWVSIDQITLTNNASIVLSDTTLPGSNVFYRTRVQLP